MGSTDTPDLLDGQSRHDEFVRYADNLRFWMARIIEGADVLGDSMDAPVRLRTDLLAVELGSLRTYIERYDDAKQALDE